MEAYYGLPENVVYCTKCVISNQRPRSTVEFRHTAAERKATIGFGSNRATNGIPQRWSRTAGSAGSTRQYGDLKICPQAS